MEHAACQAVSEHTHVHTQDMTQTHKHVQTTRHGTPNRANSPSCSYTHTHTPQGPQQSQLSLMFLHTHTHTHTSQPSPIPHTRINEASRPPHPPPSPQAHLAASWALRGCFLYFHSCAPHLPGDFAQMPPSPQASRPPHPPPIPQPCRIHDPASLGLSSKARGLFHFSLPGGPPNPHGLPPPGEHQPLEQTRSVQA